MLTERAFKIEGVYEELQPKASAMLCSQVMKQRHTETGDSIYPLPCRSWGCEYCQPKRRRQLIAMAIAGCPNKMLTLTVNTSVGESPIERRRMLHQAWVILRKRMARRLGVKNIPYMAFVEKTQQGEPHLHILLRCGYIPFKWYSANMRKLIKAPHVWINKLRSDKRAAYYVTKYVTKEPAQFGKLKRYWQSADYNTDKEKAGRSKVFTRDYDRIIRDRYNNLVEERLKQGWALKPKKDGWVDFVSPRHAVGLKGYVYYSYGRGCLCVSDRDNGPSATIDMDERPRGATGDWETLGHERA